ncbi:unnamed protein product, partial [Closterium sp. NIES-53]
MDSNTCNHLSCSVLHPSCYNDSHKKHQAKIADFGLVKMGEGTSVSTTRIMGTPGYVDPAYFSTCKATTASDVY